MCVSDCVFVRVCVRLCAECVRQAVSRAGAELRAELEEERRKYQGQLREFTRLEQRYDNLREMSQLTEVDAHDTHTGTSLTRAPHSHVHVLQPGPHSHLHLTHACTSVTCEPHSHVHETHACTSLTRARHSHVHETHTCTSLTNYAHFSWELDHWVHSTLLYPKVIIVN